jgi:hypothetical protein
VAATATEHRVVVPLMVGRGRCPMLLLVLLLRLQEGHQHEDPLRPSRDPTAKRNPPLSSIRPPMECDQEQPLTSQQSRSRVAAKRPCYKRVKKKAIIVEAS